MKINPNILDTIGKTPLVALQRYSQQAGVSNSIIAKVEAFNPGGSAKDRVALQMLKQAQADGLLQKGSTIIEPTSGNTGVGLAMACAVLDYKLILTMPDTMSIERIRLAKAYGAEAVLTPGALGMTGAIEKAQNPAIQIIGAEPAESAILNGNPAGPHKIQGIGAGFVPDTYNASVVDKVLAIPGNDAMQTARCLAQQEGILVGISSGCALAAATQLALLPENAGKTIVVLLPDTCERYLSTELF